MAEIQRSFLDFLGVVDIPKVRDEEYLVKAATAFIRNEVSPRSCSCVVFRAPSFVSDG